MEVASPLSFAPAQAGTKRAYGCSPPLMEGVVNAEPTTDDFSQPSYKKRRFNTHENSDSQAPTPSPFYATMGSQTRSPFATVNGVNKRTRTEAHGRNAMDDGRVQQEQTAEIESLKTEKATLAETVQNVKAENERLVHENRILKKAITIQQERQHHAASELEAARRYKVDADEKMRVLEQMVSTLRYHLQAQQSNTPMDSFMDSHRPPDVY